MPRDKTAAHEKIVKAAMKEFLTKGFEKASMKAVADEVGMTSAGLYRHFKDKQDMFSELVKPGIVLVEEWRDRHKQFSYQEMNQESFEKMWDISSGMNDGALILDVMYQMPEVFQLIICCSAGTPYENYIHDMVERDAHEECLGEGYFDKGVLSDALFLTYRNFANFLSCQGTWQR